MEIQEIKPSRLQLLTWSLTGTVVFECAWWLTGGGYPCSLLVFMALMCYCCGRELVNLKLLVSNTRTNIISICKEEKRSILLIALYFSVKFGLTALYPEGEQSNGSPLSLIIFTILFILIFLVPFLLKIIGMPLMFALKICKSSTETDTKRMSNSWRSTLNFCWSIATEWKRSILICLAIVLSSYLYDSNITSMVRFLGTGKPCFPLNPPKQDFDIPDNMLKAHPWHQVFPSYQPSHIVKAAIMIGRQLGEVCHLLPMLIGTYTLCQLFLPPRNSLIKKSLFASIAGVVLGGVTSGSCKILFHRYRPNAYGNPYMWTGPGVTTVNHLRFSKLDLSFPAGHTTVTSAVATCWYAFLVLNFRQLCVSPCINLLLLFCLYINPVLVLMSRVSECCHWTSDATFGVRMTTCSHNTSTDTSCMYSSHS